MKRGVIERANYNLTKSKYSRQTKCSLMKYNRSQEYAMLEAERQAGNEV